jgi:hypothetical protein
VLLNVTLANGVGLRRRFAGIYCFHFNFEIKLEQAIRAFISSWVMQVTCLACSSALMKEALRSYETSINIYQAQEIVIFVVIAVITSNPLQHMCLHRFMSRDEIY